MIQNPISYFKTIELALNLKVKKATLFNGFFTLLSKPKREVPDMGSS